MYLVYLEKIVFVVAESILDTLHQRKHLLLLKPPPHDLDGDGKPVHGIGIVQLVGALRNTI